MTKSQRMRESAGMISSTMPSVKCSCSGSPLILAKGNTAIEGLLGSGNAVWWLSDAGIPNRTRYTRSGRAIFFSILQLLVAKIFKRDLELSRGVLLHAGRYAYAAWFCQGLKARRNIHPIPKDVTVFGDNVTLVDADAELDAGICGETRVAFRYHSLHFRCSTQSVNHAGELYQHAVAGGFHDPTSMFNDFAVD